MPIYPELVTQEAGQPLDLSKITFPLKEQFTSAVSNSYWKYQTNQFVGNAANIKEHTDDPAFEPITSVEIDALKMDRPELKVPPGTSKFVASMMASMYDNDKHLGLVAESNAKNMGKIGAFGAAVTGMAGSMVGAMADPKAFIYSVAAGPAGKLLGSTIAAKAITSLGARELYGSAAARVGTLLAEKSGEAGFASAGFQLEAERAEQQKRTVLEEPHEYLQSLQNIGNAGLFGAAFGFGLGAIGIGLRGRPVMRLTDGTFIDKPPTGSAGVDADGQPWVAGREGGLLNRPEFSSMADTAKDYITRIYKPWSKDADITMREEATGQMYNGQEVNIDPVLKQGIVDGGNEFRTGIENHNADARVTNRPIIDMEAFDRQLAEAQENIVSEMFVKHFAEKEAFEVKGKTYFRGYSGEKSPYPPPSIIFNDPEFGRGYWYAESKEHAMRYGKKIDELQGEYQFYDVNKGKDEELNRLYQEVLNEKKALEGKPISSPTALLKSAINSLREAAKIKGYEGLSRIEKTEHGDKGNQIEHMFFEKPKSEEKIAKEAEAKRIADLQEQYILAQSMRDHLQDANEPLSDSEVKDYSEHLKTPGMRDNGYTTDVPKEMEKFTTDDYLAEYPPAEVNKLLESVGEKSEISKEVKFAQERVKQQPTFEKMVTELSDCILKGGL